MKYLDDVFDEYQLEIEDSKRNPDAAEDDDEETISLDDVPDFMSRFNR